MIKLMLFNSDNIRSNSFILMEQLEINSVFKKCKSTQISVINSHVYYLFLAQSKLF